MSEPELEQALSDDFRRCFASVHMLSDAPLAKPVIDAQLDAAQKSARPRMILAHFSPQSDLLNEGFEWLTSASEVEDLLRRLLDKPAEQKRRSGKQPLIYFLLSGPAQQRRG